MFAIHFGSIVDMTTVATIISVAPYAEARIFIFFAVLYCRLLTTRNLPGSFESMQWLKKSPEIEYEKRAEFDDLKIGKFGSKHLHSSFFVDKQIFVAISFCPDQNANACRKGNESPKGYQGL